MHVELAKAPHTSSVEFGFGLPDQFRDDDGDVESADSAGGRWAGLVRGASARVLHRGL